MRGNCAQNARDPSRQEWYEQHSNTSSKKDDDDDHNNRTNVNIRIRCQKGSVKMMEGFLNSICGSACVEAYHTHIIVTVGKPGTATIK